MANIELVIKITDEEYDTLINHNNNSIPAIRARTNLWKSLKNGIVLPEERGDLIDRKELLRQPMDTANYPSNYVKIAPAILKADNSESEDTE